MFCLKPIQPQALVWLSLESSTNHFNLMFKISRKRYIAISILFWWDPESASFFKILIGKDHPELLSSAIYLISLSFLHSVLTLYGSSSNFICITQPFSTVMEIQMARKPRKKRSFVLNLFKVLKYLPHQGMFFPPANSGGLLIHLFSLPPAPGTFHQMCCNKGVIFTLAMLK